MLVVSAGDYCCRVMTSGFRQDSPADQAAASREYEYLTPEKLAVAESPGQRIAIYLLVHSLEELARRRGWSESQVGSHMFFAWRDDDPRARIAPDAFLLGEPPDEALASRQTWMPGQAPPRWAAEIVSLDWGKDYRRAPDHYAELGCRELVLFDPAAACGLTHNKARAPLSIFRRSADGAFPRTYAGPGPAHSDELGCWLLPRALGYRMVLRLSEDPEGQRILPINAERADAEKQRADAEKERADAEAAARAAAEARIRVLEAALEREQTEPND